jgi:hypothetical protein
MAVLVSEVTVIAGRREAMCRFISDPRVPENTLLVAGQTQHALEPLSIRPVWRGAEADIQSHASLDDVVLYQVLY